MKFKDLLNILERYPDYKEYELLIEKGYQEIENIEGIEIINTSCFMNGKQTGGRFEIRLFPEGTINESKA